MTTQKRGPKSQTLVMVPLSELVSKLPAGSRIKISRVWYELLQETLGSAEAETEFIEVENENTKDQIFVESLDLSDETE
jgi:hypothetical protein